MKNRNADNKHNEKRGERINHEKNNEWDTVIKVTEKNFNEWTTMKR